MKKKARELVQEALKLPEAARVEIVDELLDSLRDDDAFDAEWRAEIGRRVREFLKDGNPGEPAAKVLKRIRAKLGD